MRKSTEKKVIKNLKHLKDRLNDWDLDRLTIEKILRIRDIIDHNTETHKNLMYLD